MSVDPNDPLAKLYDTSGLQDQREIIAETLFPFARIDSENFEVRFTNEGEQLVVREKLLVFLLMRKALKLGGHIAEEAVSPSEIERATGILGGTIRPALRKLVDEKLIREEGGYIVPNSRVKDINKLLIKKG
jgi:hypothetical protein